MYNKEYALSQVNDALHFLEHALEKAQKEQLPEDIFDYLEEAAERVERASKAIQVTIGRL